MRIFKVTRDIFENVPSKDIKLGLKCERFKIYHNVYQCLDNSEYWMIDVFEGSSFNIPKKQYEKMKNKVKDIVKYNYYTMGPYDLYDIYSHNVIILTCPNDIIDINKLKHLILYEYDKEKDKKVLDTFFSSF